MKKSDKIHLDLYRHTFNTDGDRSVIGDMLNKEKFLCYTLEDERRPDGVKVYGKTCIAPGLYEIEITYSNRFKRDMILIKNVKGFSGIRIHGGNTAKDTLGCPLVAYNTDYKKIWGTAEKMITKLVKDAGGKGTIEIHDAFLSYNKTLHKVIEFNEN